VVSEICVFILLLSFPEGCLPVTSKEDVYEM
jgi:hypothetical protein